MTAPAATPPAVELVDVSKTYPNGVVACRRATITIAAGSVHAIVGENGAGKSTLMKILYGLEQPSGGEIRRAGQVVKVSSPLDAIANGIGMVHQNFMLVPSFTVADNVVLGAEPVRAGLVDRDEARRAVIALGAAYGLPVDPDRRVQDLSVGAKQRVEILKALHRGADVLILDEPTAVLTPQETEQLFEALRALAADGRSVVFISHKLREVLAVSDQVSVMRGGEVVGTVATAETDTEALARMMVGRDVVLRVPRPPATPGATRLAVEAMTCRGDLGTIACRDVSLEVRAGEIVGIAGVEGNGQTELAEVITGIRTSERGRVLLDGTPIEQLPIKQRRLAGLGHIPEDRLHDGAALTESIADNVVVDRYRRRPFSRGWRLSRRAIVDHGEHLVAEYGIRAPDSSVPVGALSGGNIQKVVVARELSAEPGALVAAQPTRGVDIGAMESIYRRLLDARTAGLAVLLISADLSEVLTLSDRVLVMKDGAIVAEFDDQATFDEERIGLAMLGVTSTAGAP